MATTGSCTPSSAAVVTGSSKSAMMPCPAQRLMPCGRQRKSSSRYKSQARVLLMYSPMPEMISRSKILLPLKSNAIRCTGVLATLCLLFAGVVGRAVLVFVEL
jgi:hypothetical protein